MYESINIWLTADLRRATTAACRPLLPRFPPPPPGVAAAARETPAAPPAPGGGAPRQSPPPAAPVPESGQQPACPEHGEALSKVHFLNIGLGRAYARLSQHETFQPSLKLGLTYRSHCNSFAARSPIRSSQPVWDSAVSDGAAPPRQRVEVRCRGRRRRGPAASAAAAASPAAAPVVLLLLGIAV